MEAYGLQCEDFLCIYCMCKMAWGRPCLLAYCCVHALVHTCIIIYQFTTHTHTRDIRMKCLQTALACAMQYSFLQTHGPARYISSRVVDKAWSHSHHLCDFWCFHRACNWLEMLCSLAYWLVNPRRACAARVTVVLFVCLSLTASTHSTIVC